MGAALQPENRVDGLHDRRLRSACAVEEARARMFAGSRHISRLQAAWPRLGQPPNMSRLDERKKRIRLQMLLADRGRECMRYGGDLGLEPFEQIGGLVHIFARGC